MNKNELRAFVFGRRKCLTQDFVSENSKKICDLFIEKYSNPNLTVCAYVSIHNEVDTKQILEHYKHVYLPKTIGDEIDFYKYDGALEKGAFGILEPKSEKRLETVPDIVIVPGVGFDKDGNRAGYGKGYYDRFFARVKCKIKTGFAFSFQVTDKIDDAWENDVRMDELITENGFIIGR